MNHEQKIAEIREALEKATPGPWTKFENRIYGKAQPAVEPIICEFYEEETERDRNNAHLIANAPEWLQFLLNELERLKQERDMYKASSEVFYERLKKAWEERDKLIEVLRWYADDNTYEIQRRVLGDFALISSDQGQRARNILREVGVTVE